MTKSELNAFFLQKIEEREEIERKAMICGFGASFEERKDIVTSMVGNTADIVSAFSEYLINDIQPFSDLSAVWWAYVLKHVEEHIEKTFDKRQKELLRHIKDMMIPVETSTVVVDMSQFPGGMKNE